MAGWNFADVWELIADRLPGAPAQVNGDRRFDWASFDRRADGVATILLGDRIRARRQDKVALYLHNGPEYLESMFGIFKAGLVPVNTNYRYGEDELTYLWDNADAVAVVFHGCFAERVEVVRPRLPGVKAWLWVDDGSGPPPGWAIRYEEAATAAASGRTVPEWPRDGDDLVLIYTGGTTGLPKGVMWRQDDLFAVLNRSSPLPYGDDPDPAVVEDRLTQPGFVICPAAPLMHGTGCLTALAMLSTGGSVVTLTSRRFDPVELLDTIGRERVNTLSWVGEAFARPVIAALDADPGRWDLSSLFMVVSSGAMWSEASKAALMAHHPGVLIVDAFASSEAVGLGLSVSTGGSAAATARFVLGVGGRVITDDGRDVQPGSGEIGRVALQGRTPIGYYKDPEKSKVTFPVIDGQRYSMPGDYATVEADGTLILLGRGSVCINTGGEKVFPEEVEEVLKQHPSVADAAVVGVPDERFGEAVTAVVEPAPGADVGEADLISHVKAKLAPFKAPKRVIEVPTIGRAPNGKVDYRRLRQEAVERLRSTTG